MAYDPPKTNFKAVSFYNGNSIVSVPLTHSTNTKETYGSVSNKLILIQYSNHFWHIYGDPNATSL